jgi:hypothetical protein
MPESMSGPKPESKSDSKRGGLETGSTALSHQERLTLALGSGVGLTWFGVTWIARNRAFYEALGEAFGGLMVVLLLFSILGTLNGPEERENQRLRAAALEDESRPRTASENLDRRVHPDGFVQGL